MLEVPGEFSSIQSALDAASAGDTVWVEAGTYHEMNLSFLGKDIVLLGSCGPEECILDAQGGARILDVTSGESIQAKLIGFTLTQASGPTGAAIRIINDSYLTIQHCRFLNNSGNRHQPGACHDWKGWQLRPLFCRCSTHRRLLV